MGIYAQQILRLHATWREAFHEGLVCGGELAVGQNPLPLVNIKIGGKWMFIHPKMEPYAIPHGQIKTHLLYVYLECSSFC